MNDGGGADILIRPATAADHPAIWTILEPVYRAGETYCIPPDISRDAALADWFAAPFTAFVAELDGRVLGTSHVGRNRPGPAAHVANASFATHPDARGKGIARRLVTHAKDWARDQGFRAMQGIAPLRDGLPVQHIAEANRPDAFISPGVPE